MGALRYTQLISKSAPTRNGLRNLKRGLLTLEPVSGAFCKLKMKHLPLLRSKHMFGVRPRVAGGVTRDRSVLFILEKMISQRFTGPQLEDGKKSSFSLPSWNLISCLEEQPMT